MQPIDDDEDDSYKIDDFNDNNGGDRDHIKNHDSDNSKNISIMESVTWMVASLAYDKKYVKGSRPNSGNTRRSIEDDDYDDFDNDNDEDDDNDNFDDDDDDEYDNDDDYDGDDDFDSDVKL